MGVATILDEAMGRWGGRIAVSHGETELTYEQLRSRANRLAAGMAERGARRQDRVALILPNRPEFIEVMLASWAAGAIIVPVNPKLHPEEWTYILQQSGARFVVTERRVMEALADARPALDNVAHWIVVDAYDAVPDGAVGYEAALADQPLDAPDEAADGDVAWLFYTSGTTGRPKGACITHGNLKFMSEQYFRRIYEPAGEKRVLHIGPLTHASGLWSLPLIKGGASHFLLPSRSFDPVEALGTAQRQRVHKIVFVAPVVIRLLMEAQREHRFDLSVLEFIGYGGSPTSPELLKQAIAEFGPVFCQIYGQGECPMTISTLLPSDHDYEEGAASERRLASAGRPILGNEVRAIDDDARVCEPGDVGEIAIRGDGVMRGYWDNDAATKEVFDRGWYRTGDLGHLDEDDYVFLGDRKRELIISGGANVYPKEVEDVLSRHPDVVEVAVVGVPDDKWGESVLAVVGLGEGEAPGEEELSDLCRQHLAGYKKPRHFRFVQELPKDNLGKVSKRRLRESFLGERADAAS